MGVRSRWEENKRMQVQFDLVLEAVAVEAYRSGVITPAQVQRIGLRSRWETESFLRRAEAHHDYTMDDLERDIAPIRDASRQ